jgi:glycosyltransferase involved in cell wall biosynthesis
LKILHLIYTSGPFGAEKHLLQLLPELKKYNIFCEVIFICPQKNITAFKEYCQEMNELGIKITLLPVRSKISLFSKAHSVYRYLKKNEISFLHSHLFSADFIAVLIKKLYLPRLVIFSTKHGYEEKYLLQYGLGNKKINYNFYYFISRFIIKRIDHNVAVSKTLSQLYSYLKLVKKEMKYINHGIKPNKPDLNAKDLPGHPKIMIVGRLSEIKGHIYLLKAMPKVITKFPNVKLYILGIGPLKDNLYNHARNLNILNHVEFVGLENPANYTQHCQVMVLPSLFESFGLVFIESFALKIPVIAFDTVAGNQIIDNNKTGFLVKKEDIQALAEKIIHVMNSSKISAEIVENAYNKFLAEYTVEKMSKETANWYIEVTKKYK